MIKNLSFFNNKFRTEADYFGFMYQLSFFLNKKNKRANSTLYHGWMPFKVRSVERFFHSDEELKLVPSQKIYKFLNQNNIKSFPVGIPFINYIKFGQEIKVNRKKNSGLITLRHSHPHFKYKPKEIILKYIEWAKQNFDYFAFMVPVSDLKNYLPTLKKFNIDYELGADVRDLQSFPRMKKIFHKYEFLVSSSFGSQLIYGAYCNMKVGIFKDIFEPYNFEDFEKNPWYKKHMFLIDEIIFDLSYKNLENNFSELLVSHKNNFIKKTNKCFEQGLVTTDPLILYNLLG